MFQFTYFFQASKELNLVIRKRAGLDLFPSESSGTECPKIYRKSVLHLLKYRFKVYLSRCSTDLRYILGRSVFMIFFSFLCFYD